MPLITDSGGRVRQVSYEFKANLAFMYRGFQAVSNVFIKITLFYILLFQCAFDLVTVILSRGMSVSNVLGFRSSTPTFKIQLWS